MACYKIQINNQTFTLVNNSLQTDVEGNLVENFIKTLQMYKDSTLDDHKLTYENLTNALQGIDKTNQLSDQQYLNSITLRKEQESDLLPIIQANLKSLGVEMKIVAPKDLQALGLSLDTKAAVKDGVIYVRKDAFKISDTIHELSHLLLGVLKVQNFKTYQNIIYTLSKHPQVEDIYNSLTKFNAYSTDFELDKQEEAVVRFLERFVTQEPITEQFQYGNQIIDVADFLDTHLQAITQQVLGITKYPGIVTLFKSLVADIPVFGSSMFIRPKTESTGFIKYKNDAIKSAQISDYIKKLFDRGLIQKGDCI